ncbi:hypothetical protein KC19_12G047400 [Ceratodon purpureus]|uniref:Protein kinase domain-containing protein n=1 Tax=Ceratodon purpureus TaxID=3225 RepID=A0A8T0G622_CERPU|nr:hypothetical protein KC19_12G047400 [Ceratodon purpureus]
MAGEDLLSKLFTLLGHEPPNFLDLCEKTVRSIEETLSSGGTFLNQRQCQDLLSKLSKATHNIQELVLHCGSASADHFQTALENLYRYLEKAKLLVQNCGEKEWWVAAVSQSHNQNAFREILLEVGLCYNAIYEQAKSISQEWDKVHPDDLRQPSVSVFVPASPSDVQEDQQEIQQRLEVLANDPNGANLEGREQPDNVALKAQCLARYLLLTMDCASEQSQATALDAGSAILWKKDHEPEGTWGNLSSCLGVGATDGGVYRTEWLGMPCAKKEFHVKEYESLFLKEAGIMAHLKHPCVINFLCCSNGELRGDRFIAMELMEKSLSDLIEEKAGNISFPVVLDTIVQIAHGMLYLHDQGVAHRDLKPQNVVVNTLTYPQKSSSVFQPYALPLLEPSYCAKLVDFGTSKTQVVVSKSNTMTYQGIGTAVYRAPEVLPRGNRLKLRANWFKADVFSFAMTCVHVLTSKKPFQDVEGTYTKDALYNALMNGVRPKLPADCPQELVELLKDCWNTIPRKRPTFMDICTRLETFRHKILRGLTSEKVQLETGDDFIKTKIEEQSSLQKVLFHSTSLTVEEESDQTDLVSVISCTSCKRALEFLPQSPYDGSDFFCNICCENWQQCEPHVYHCESCQFDTHSECAEIKSHKLEVFFHHHHPLHLLVQDYYHDNPDAVCHFCLDPLQGCEWVYRCEQCDFDVHALCAKYCKDLLYNKHSHTLTLVQCPPNKSFLCTRCNGKIREHTWRYTCTLKQCTFHMHPICATLTWNPLCPCNKSHRLSLRCFRKSFKCWCCDAAGFSWSYHCNFCDDVDIHPDCIDDIGEQESNWIGQYEIVIENGTGDNHSEAIQMISELLDKFPVGSALEASTSSSSSRPPSVTRVQSSIQRLSLAERPSLDASEDEKLQRKIASETAKRIKVKKTAAKEARQKLRENSLEMLDNLERIILGLQDAHENMSEADAEALAATHEKLKGRRTLVKEQAAMKVQSSLSQGPRYGLFFTKKTEDGELVRELLTSLQGAMKGVCFIFLCEEPGHEHCVPGLSRIFNKQIGESLAEKVQPLLVSGLQIVTRAMSTLDPNEVTDLKSVTLPSLGMGKARWDLGALDPTFNIGNRSLINLTEDKEKVDELRRAVGPAAEWFRNDILEKNGVNILASIGLQRVRYKATAEGDTPKYRRGTLAWLCSDHVNSGLKDGKLESYPLKYFNVEDDHQQRWPNHAMY